MAIIGKPGSNWTSQRDHLLRRMLYNTGARVSEIIDVRWADVVPDGVARVHLHGKVRKQIRMPLFRSTVKAVQAWLKCNPNLSSASALLPNRDGHEMTRANVVQRLAPAVCAGLGLHRRVQHHGVQAGALDHAPALRGFCALEMCFKYSSDAIPRVGSAGRWWR